MNFQRTEADRFLEPSRPTQFSLLVPIAIGAMCFGFLRSDLAPIQAQGRFNMATQANAAELLPPPRSVRQQLREADEAIEEERYSDAVVRLGNLLRRVSRDSLPETAQDYFLDSGFGTAEAVDGRSLERQFSSDESSAPQPKTVMRLARDRIGGLPKAGWEIYELRYGPLAAKTLVDAEKDLDWQSVEQVRREFFHTEAGYRASYLLAVREWFLGNPLAVSLLLDDVVGVPRALDQLGDQVIWLHAGATLLAERTLTYPIRLPADMVEDENAENSNDVLAMWANAVRGHFGREPITMDPMINDHAFLGATPSRNGVSQGQMPLSNPRWMLETSGSPRQERFIDSETEQLKANGSLPPPSWAPLRVGDQLLMRTTERLLGVDHRTGKRVWEYPWFSSADSVEPDEEDDPNNLRDNEDPRAILGQRVWNDVPYGQLSSDGSRVFMIDDLELVESERPNPFGMRGVRSLKASKNTLVALDLATEGKLLWRLGADENTPSSLADAFFLGPPLPVRGRLYAMVELAGEVLLVCLDPKDGTELWRQVLVSVESSGITTDPTRRVAGAMPTYHNGLLICPTGTGITIAMDLIDQSFRWVQRHPRNIEPVRHALRPPTEVSMTRLSQRWATSVAVGHGNSVALTPVESDRMIVVDAATGKERFGPQPRIKNLYLAGIRNGQYVIVRADRVMGYDLNTGVEAWSTTGDLMQAGQRVSGRGVFGAKSYFLPTSTDELIEISTEDGRVVSRRNVRFPLGNLIAIDGEIISQGTTTLAVAYGEQSLAPVVNRMLKENPDDFFATVRKAELLLEQDQRDEALSLLSKARTIAPENDEVILLSVEAMLGSLRDQKELSEDDVQTLKGLIDRPEQSAELMVLQVNRLIESDQWESAFDLLLELSRLLVEIPSLSNLQNQILPTPGRSFPLSSWVTARVDEIHGQADEATREKLSDRLQEHLSRFGDPGRFSNERRLDHFQSMWDSIDARYQQKLDHLHRQGDVLAVERLAWGSKLPTDSGIDQLDSKALLHLARVYSEARWDEDRGHIGEILKSRELSEPETNQLAEYPRRGAARTENIWPEQVALKWESARMYPSHMLASDRRYAKTIHLMGRTTRGWQAVSDTNPLSILDEHGISRSIAVEGLTSRNSTDKEVTISGGLMIVLTPSELIAVDLFRVLSGSNLEAVRWRRSLSADGQALAKLRSETSKFGDEIYRYLTNTRTANADEAQLRLGPVLGNRLFLLKGDELICFHTVTGQPLWQTEIGFPGSGLVAKDGRVAVISERADRVISFNWFDGKKISTKPLLIGSLMTTIGNHALLVSKYDAESDPTSIPARNDLHDPYLVEIFDPIEMKRLQSRVASPINLTDEVRSSGYGELIEGRYFGLVDDLGQTTVWDVLEGKQLAEVKIPLRPRLTGVSMLRMNDRFVILPRCKLTESTVRTGMSVAVSNGSSVKGATSAHCIKIGQENQPATVDWSESFFAARGVTTHQPFDTPMLLMARGKFYNTSTALRRREIDVWGLDVATGKTLIQQLGKQVNSSNPQIETDIRLIQHRNQMIATIQNEFLTFSFTEPATTEESKEGSGDEPVDDLSAETPSEEVGNPSEEASAAQP